MAAGSVYVMNLSSQDYAAHVQPQLSHINVGFGSDVTIAELAEALARVIGYGGRIVFDADKPDGAPRKLMDSSRLNAMGWSATVPLEEGLSIGYRDFLNHNAREK